MRCYSYIRYFIILHSKIQYLPHSKSQKKALWSMQLIHKLVELKW